MSGGSFYYDTLRNSLSHLYPVTVEEAQIQAQMGLDLRRSPIQFRNEWERNTYIRDVDNFKDCLVHSIEQELENPSPGSR